MPSRSLFALVLALAPVGAALGAACAANSEAVRNFIAPDFSNIDDTRLQDAMWRLGSGAQALNDAFSPEAGLSDADRKQRVVEILDVMAEAAAAVNKEPQKKAHANIAMNIDKLIDDIAAAQTAAKANDLAPAQALPQTCLACHEGGGGGPQKKG